MSDLKRQMSQVNECKLNGQRTKCLTWRTETRVNCAFNRESVTIKDLVLRADVTVPVKMF